ncbi:hypothetical protein BDQ17DRAFT_1371092 [Cyathus striatus]|nr:hypothetical protein BDQ17DRAFT_1371092 [Cyathus striatus]
MESLWQQSQELKSKDIPHATPDVTTSLPTEVLLRIFKLVSLNHLQVASTCTNACIHEETGTLKTCGCDEKAKRIRWNQEWKAIQDDRIFPFCLANVCQRWCEIMQIYPEWWTRFRVIMNQGSPARILSNLRYQIERTKRILPLQVFIVKRTKDAQELGPDTELMKIVRPHMHRVEKIVIQATHGSSLPLISSGVFSNATSLLKELKLECTSYPVIQSLSTPIPSVPHSVRSSSVSNYVNVVLGGPTFLDACLVPEFWTGLLSRYSSIDLKISHVKTDESFNANDFVKTVCSGEVELAVLTLEDIEFPEGNIWEDIELNGPGDLCFMSMTSTSLLPFFDNPIQLGIYRSRTTGVKYPKSEVLMLGDIAEDQDIADAIISVDPTTLYVDDCPGLDDYALGAIGHLQDGLDEDNCSRLRDINITGKTSITPRGLKQFIRGRQQISDRYFTETDEDIHSFESSEDWESIQDHEPAYLRRLSFRRTGYELSQEDLDFFSESVHKFEWIP